MRYMHLGHDGKNKRFFFIFFFFLREKGGGAPRISDIKTPHPRYSIPHNPETHLQFMLVEYVMSY